MSEDPLDTQSGGLTWCNLKYNLKLAPISAGPAQLSPPGLSAAAAAPQPQVCPSIKPSETIACHTCISRPSWGPYLAACLLHLTCMGPYYIIVHKLLQVELALCRCKETSATPGSRAATLHLDCHRAQEGVLAKDQPRATEHSLHISKLLKSRPSGMSSTPRAGDELLLLPKLEVLAWPHKHMKGGVLGPSPASLDLTLFKASSIHQYTTDQCLGRDGC